MSLLLDNVVFFAFAGMAFLVGLVAILWGSQAKIMGAGLLLASIIAANILFWLNVHAFLGHELRSVGYVIIDLTLAYVFLWIYSRSDRLERNRWAAYIAIIQIIMALISIARAAYPAFPHHREYALTLNILMIIAFVICFIAFTPKSRNEVIGVLKMKWLYLMSDIFKRVIAPLRYGRVKSEMAGKRDTSAIEIDTQIGAKIREARITRELSQEKLADAIGVSPSQVQKIESGANRVSARTLFALSAFLGVEINFFYHDIKIGATLAAVKR